jgi:lipoprotein-releasing system permease protein
MIRPLEFFIGLRYLSTGRGRGFVSFMSVASFLGIGLGVAALLVILSAMNGLESESRSRLLSLSEHITLRPANGGADFQSLTTQLSAVDGVATVVPFVRLEAMLSSGAALWPVIVRGIDPEAEGPDSDLRAVIGDESIDRLMPGSGQVLLGRFLAARLNVLAGDRVTLWLADVDDGRPRPRRTGFTVGDVFLAGVDQHDTSLVLMHVSDASQLLGLGGAPDALAIRLDEPMDVVSVGQTLRDGVGPGYEWSDWADENRSLFRAMSIEKTMMTIVLMFIAGIAAFNIVASLTMAVNEKEKDIAILRTLGLEPERVRRIFLLQGALIGIGGTVAGLVAGLLLALNLETVLPWLEATFGFRIMPGEIYYITTVPSEIRIRDFVLIPGIAVLISLLATIYPALRAARIEPAEVLRYE